MTRFLLRFRWAIVLAVLQTIVFLVVGLSEHRRTIRSKRKYEWFGCFPLAHSRVSNEERGWDLSTTYCGTQARIKFIFFSNLPVFVVWGEVAELTRNTDIDQVHLFYLMNGFGIPVFWFYIGSLIDRRRIRKGATVLNP